MTLRICIVEDDRRFRQSLELLFHHAPDFELAASFRAAESFLGALDAAPGWSLVVMDLDLPGLDGIEAIRRIRSSNLLLPVVVLTAFDDSPRIREAIRAGAQGYLVKNQAGPQILDHLRTAAAGGAPLTQDVARSVLGLIRGDRLTEPIPDLSPREHEVLELLCRGRSYKQVASELCLSVETVRSYVRTLYPKLGVHSATEAVSKALREGWVRG